MSYYATSSIAQAFTQFFQTSITQVSAASFDTGVFPSALTGEPLGNSSYQWSSINNVIDFSGNNVGIDTVGAPAEALSVNGGVQLLTTATSTVTCNATYTRNPLVLFARGFLFGYALALRRKRVGNAGVATDLLIDITVEGRRHRIFLPSLWITAIFSGDEMVYCSYEQHKKDHRVVVLVVIIIVVAAIWYQYAQHSAPNNSAGWQPQG